MIRVPGQKLHTPVTFPVVLSRSRDYNSIELLFWTIFNYFYVLSVESKNIHNPLRCKAELLPLLADYYRYEYTDVESIKLERQIIGTIPELHHNKGTSVGISNALSLSRRDKKQSVTIPWFYQKETNTVIVIVLDNISTYKMYELLCLVVPLGTKVELKPGKSIKASEEIKMHSWTEVNFGALDPNKQWYVTPNNVWLTEWDPKEKLYHTYVDYQRNIGSDGLDVKDAEGNIVKSKDIAGTRVGNTEIAKNQTKTPDSESEE